MPAHSKSVKVAAAHAAPVFLDAQGSVDKACSLIAEAAAHGARLIAFPETFIPAFPIWAAVRAPIYNHELFKRLAANSIRIDGPEMAQLREAARKNGILVSIGFNEGTTASVGCIWNSNALIGDDGAILVHHRKLVPTFYEKLVWANGDGAGLRVSDTPIGRIGMLICGENTNPLARYALMAQGEQIHVSSYPPVWPTRDPRGNQGNYDLRSAILIRAGAHSFEAKAFNVVASGYLDKATLDAIGDLGKDEREILERTPRGISVIIAPTGMPIGAELQDEEGILYGDLDLAACVEPKQFHDVVGYYNRFDIFDVTVDRRANRPISFHDGMKPQMDEPVVSGTSRGDELS
jgi:aliphatic nitrilase